MEPFKIKKPDNTYGLNINLDPIDYFGRALEFVKEHYQEEFDHIANTKFSDITAETFFKEIIWVIYVSGFNAKIISQIYPKLLEVYNSLFEVAGGKTDAVNTLDIAVASMEVFANKCKVKAVIDAAFMMNDGIKKFGWEKYKNEYLNEPDKLKVFPFIGNITKNHLARNIGLLDFIKADLHLNRAAKHWKFENPIKMCEKIQEKFNFPLGLIDLVLFYSFATFGSREN